MNRKLILKYHWLTSFNNLYNFILIILNNFFLNFLKIPTDGFTEGIYPSIFYKELFTGNTTITDVVTDGYIPSSFYRELKNIYWICHYHRRNKSVGIFPAIIFFLRAFSVCKIIGIFFFPNKVSDGM